MATISYRPIGVVHSPFAGIEGMPIQPGGRTAAPGTIEIFDEYEEGLRDLDGFSHLILLVDLHQAPSPRLTVAPFPYSEPHGIFATRAPARPNPIGLSVVELIRREGTMLLVDGLDFVEGTPVLDVKPYLPELDAITDGRVGWLEPLRDQLSSK